ncbi:hypothetical protein FAI40_04695 [Acetobacteraceae bacterium]|nr:hypothetical protein FAI40_04695 [Acetobacteraceae bacterium]
MKKTFEYLVETGDDAGKQFFITKMPTFKADKWAQHLVKTLAAAGSALLPSLEKYPVQGLEQLAIVFFGRMNLEDLEKIFDGLLQCVQVKRKSEKAEGEITPLREGDIEDAMTFVNLRVKAFELHTDFIHATYQFLLPSVAATIGIATGLSEEA